MRKTLKILLYIVIGLLILVGGVVGFLLSPSGQRFVTKQTTSFLSNKLKTPFKVGKIRYKIPNSVGIDDLLVIDQNNDTLVYLHYLDLKVDIWELLNTTISVKSLEIENASFYMHRKAPDSFFNFQYIIDAFASTDTSKTLTPKEDAANAEPLKIELVKTLLKNIKFRLHDESGGTDFALSVKELLLKPNSIDLASLTFDVDELLIAGAKSNLIMTESILPPTIDTSTATSPLTLKVKKLQLNSVEYTMDMRTSPLYMKVNIGELDASIPVFDLNTQTINVDKLHLLDSKTLMVMGKTQSTAKVIDTTTDASLNTDTLGWRITANDVKFKNIQYKMDNLNQPVLKYGMDYAHMDIQNLYLVADNLLYTNDTILGKVKQLTLAEKSGFQLNEFKTNFRYTSKGALLDNLMLKTPQTTLSHKLAISYASLDELTKNLGKMRLDVLLENSKIGINDVLLFVPDDLRNTLSAYKNQQLNVATNLNGPLDNLNINKFNLSGLSNTNIQLNGKLLGLPDSEKLRYQLYVTQLQTSKKDIDPFLTDSIKMLVNLPDKLIASGDIKGSIYEYHPNLKILSTDGNALINGSVTMLHGQTETYDLDLKAQNLLLGKILRQDSLIGAISANIKIKGNSFDINSMQTTVDLDIFSAHLLGYNYNSIKGNIDLNNGNAIANLSSRDSNFNIDLLGTAYLHREYPDIDAKLYMHNVDLMALKFTNDTLKLAGTIDAKLPALNIDYPTGAIVGSDMEVTIPGNKLPLDSLIILANSNPVTGQKIYMDIAKIVNLDLRGEIPLTKIPSTYLYHINKHYNLGDTFDYAQNYNMDLNGSINYNPILTRFNRKIRPFDTMTVSSHIENSFFDLSLFIPKFRYAKHHIDSGYVFFKEDSKHIRYAVGTKKYYNVDYPSLFYPGVAGNIKNDTLFARLTVKDTAANNRFLLGVAANKDLSQENSNVNIRMFKGLMIDYDLWRVQENNNITLSGSDFKISNFFIERGNQKIALNSIADTFKSPIAVNIDNFQLGSITKIMNPDTLMAEGAINSRIEVNFNTPMPAIKGIASIDSLKIYNSPMGNLALYAHTKNENTYNAFLSLEGYGNKVALSGDYYIEKFNGNNFDFKLNIQPFTFKSIEGLTFGNLKNSSGALNGLLNIRGTIDRPRITGDLYTDNIQTTVSMLNGSFKLPKERIAFTERGIVFDNVKIQDYKNTTATLDGRVNTRDYINYFLNLDFNSNNWSPINSKSKDYEMLYGKLFMSANIKASGMATSPNITGNLTVHDSTQLTFAMLDSDPQLVETEGIVEFYDHRFPNDDWVEQDSVNTFLSNMQFSNTTKMNVNVAVEKNAAFNLIIDPNTGDNLLVKGEASLNAQIAPNGSIGLAGIYSLEDGYYELSFPPIKRKFSIQKGSTISLAGDPLDATVDVVAVYKANVAPYDLVERQVSDPAQLVYYKQRLPFEVQLKLNGNALSPNISFDIVLPEGVSSVSSDVANTVQSKLNQIRNNPSEVNKQVFAMIVLNRFITDESFNGGNVVNVEFVARQSVSRFLSSQLNNLAGQFISGFDINMDVESSEDYTTGSKVNRTDLNVSASKSLFNDRLSVTVGNDFLLEGANNAGGRSAGIPGNISADYKITEDGRYIIRGYRKNELQNLIDGFVSETGIGFRYSLQYNRFKYLFVSKEKLRAKYKSLLEEERKKQEALMNESRQSSSNSTQQPSQQELPVPSAQLGILPNTSNRHYHGFRNNDN